MHVNVLSVVKIGDLVLVEILPSMLFCRSLMVIAQINSSAPVPAAIHKCDLKVSQGE
jgi:hypothetical protein